MCHEDKVTTISETERKSLHSILIINTKCDIINKKVQLIIRLAITIVKRYAMSEDNNIAANDTKGNTAQLTKYCHQKRETQRSS